MESAWINDAKDYFLKHYVEIVALEMLWRYGLGPRPSNMDPDILTVHNLEPLDVLVSSERNDAGLKTSEAAEKGANGTEVSEQEKEVGE